MAFGKAKHNGWKKWKSGQEMFAA